MKRFLLAGLLALAIGLGGADTARAQFGSSYNCGGLCALMAPHINQHGPLYNYGPYDPNGNCGGHCGHGGHGGIGGLFHHNGGCNSCGGRAGLGWSWGGHGWIWGSHGCNSCGHGGWGHYARATFSNVFHRLHPTAHKCGQSCGLSCGQAGGCSTGGQAQTTTAAQPEQPGIARVNLQ